MIAATSRSMVQRLTNYYKEEERLFMGKTNFVDPATGEVLTRKEFQQRFAPKFPQPWDRFRAELEARLDPIDPMAAVMALHLSTYEPEDKTVMIAYATMYGNTENAANVLAGMLADKGVKNIAMYDVSETDVSELVAESFRCSHLVLAAPTYNSGIQPKMEAYLSDIKALNLQNRTVAVIDNGTWAATAGKQMIGMLEGMKNMTILENPISIKSALAENQLGALEALADELAKQVNG